jgi:serine/threonine protein kinase
MSNIELKNNIDKENLDKFFYESLDEKIIKICDIDLSNNILVNKGYTLYDEKENGDVYWYNYRCLCLLDDDTGAHGTIYMVEKNKGPSISRGLSVLKIFIDKLIINEKMEMEIFYTEYIIENQVHQYIQNSITSEKHSPNFSEYRFSGEIGLFEIFNQYMGESWDKYIGIPIYQKLQDIYIYFSRKYKNRKNFQNINTKKDFFIKILEKNFGKNSLLKLYYIESELSDSGQLRNLILRINPVNRSNEYGKSLTRNIIFQLCIGLHYMEKNNIQHRDIAGSNILCTTKRYHHDIIKNNRNNIFKLNNIYYEIIRYHENNKGILPYYIPIIIDFSLSQVIQVQGKDNIIETSMTRLYYRAPELLFIDENAKKVIYEYKYDVFSCGLTIMEYLTYDFINHDKIYQYITDVYNKEYNGLYKELLELIKETCPKTKIHNEFILKNDSGESVLDQTLTLISYLGWPDNVESFKNSYLWKILDIYLPETIKNRKGIYFNNPIINERLTENGLQLLKHMLDWDINNRISFKDGLFYNNNNNNNNKEIVYFNELIINEDKINEEDHLIWSD